MSGRNPEYGAKDQDRFRSKIKVAQIIEKLNAHILGKAKMTGTMVRAAEILLRKVQPDLTATSLTEGLDDRLPVLKIVRRDQDSSKTKTEGKAKVA